jgi:hypothetical protein
MLAAFCCPDRSDYFMTAVRHITVHVDESDPGHFWWVLMEQGADASIWNQVEAAKKSFEGWFEAFSAGSKALRRYVPDA